MQRPLVAVPLVFGLLALACDGSEDGTDTDGDPGGPMASPGAVLLLADVNPEPLCGTVGVTQVQLIATRVGCESPPPAPCTLPAEPRSVDGDVFTCPNTDPSTLLGVEVELGGRYQVQTVVEYTTGETEARCHTAGGDPEVLVRADEVEAGVVRMLDDGDVACP